MMDKDGSPLHNLQSVSDVKIVYDNYMDQVYVARTLNLSLSVNISSQVAHGYSISGTRSSGFPWSLFLHLFR